MNTHNATIIGGLCIALLAGCNEASVKEQAVTAAIAPMENPNHNVNYTRSVTKDGEEYTSKIVAVENGTQQWESSNGCNYRSLDMFAPADSWSGCDSTSNGTQSVTPNGNPWPLSVGKRWSYAFSGRNDAGNDWQGTRDCEAEATAQISTPGGQHDTYKVICEDKFSKRTYYVSPALKDYAKLVQWRKRAGETVTYDMLKAG